MWMLQGDFHSGFGEPGEAARKGSEEVPSGYRIQTATASYV